jgi:hypothetical protein
MDVDKSCIEGFPMVVRLFGETTGFAKHPSDAMSQGPIIPRNTNRKLFTQVMGILQKCRYETLSFISNDELKNMVEQLEAGPVLITERRLAA